MSVMKRKRAFAAFVGICLFQVLGCGKSETSTVVAPEPVIPKSELPVTPATPGNVPVQPSTPAVTPTPATPTTPPVSTPTPPQPVPGAPTVTIEPEFVRVATLEVEGFPDKTVGFDVGVKGQTTGDQAQCEFITQHRYIRTDAKWSPAPISLYSVTDSERKLSPLFEETLDFVDSEKKIQKNTMTILVDFVRGKIFRSMLTVRAYPYKKQDGTFGCHAFLTICLNPRAGDNGFSCTNPWRKLERLAVVIDRGRHLLAFRQAERDKDDVAKMVLSVKNLDANGFPIGNTRNEDFTDFINR